MAPTPTHWMEYGEPAGDGRVEETRTVTYQTGPNETREDEVTEGTLPMDVLELWEESRHVHDDGSLCLSALPGRDRQRIEAAFEAVDGEGPTVVDREWTEAATSTHRYEQLVVERGGERVTVPIIGIDHPEHPEYWDADRVYVFDGRLVAEAERDDGTVWSIEEAGRTSGGDIALDGHIVEQPTGADVADDVLWTREEA